MKSHVAILTIMISLLCCKQNESSQGEEFLSNINQIDEIVDDTDKLTFFDRSRTPIDASLEQLPSGTIKPRGWLLDMMKQDLETGMVGSLDELYPAFQVDDIYGANRRGGVEDVPEMGDLVLTGAAWEKSIMWWNSETFGNWWDGFVRHAFLTENKQAIQQSREIAENLVSSQDEDGYIGIYKNNLRYKHDGSNGELWAQTTAFRTLLAYYEFTNDEKVLSAVEKAMALTMKEYNSKSRNPFNLKNAFGGATHGLMLTDVCETLHRITGKDVYRDYAVDLYRAFSTFSVNRSFNDVRYPYLTQKDSLFTGHAAHTYEHLRSLIHAYYGTGYPEMKTAFENAMYKLESAILPSGAGHGNEWILALLAHPDNTTAEFCSMLELRNFYISATQKTGQIDFADKVEKLTFNGMMGFRNEDGTAITYGKGDNCSVLDGKHHEHGTEREDPRYKYSPTHSEPAVCCAPNYSRNHSYYVENMWMKNEVGLVALFYGPSVIKTSIDGTDIVIEQKTNYPFSDEIVFEIRTSEEIELPLSFRQPNWVKSMRVNSDSVVGTFNDGFFELTKTWKTGDEIEIKFEHEIKKKTANNNEHYLQRGPLVYAYEIPHKSQVIKSFELGNFRDYYCFPTNDQFDKIVFDQSRQDKNFGFSFVGNTDSPKKDIWHSNVYSLQGKMVDKESNEQIDVNFIPIGSTILRKVTFPVAQ